MLVYALTIFVGAFLLFQVQPLIGKYILPWFGGGPGVWTTCMLFFQVLLLGGYAYAHWLTRFTKARTQAVVQLSLTVVAVAMLPIIPGQNWKPAPGSNPTLQILALLAACVGIPYFVLSATGPLLQRWFSETFPGRSPYRLYSLSNAGSLLALISYPFVFEPQITRKTQASFWGWGLALYAVFSALCAVQIWRSQSAGKQKAELPTITGRSRPDFLRRFLWIAFPACASLLLLAVTNKLCQDVAVIPFLWIAPLSLYLLSFIICFEHQRWYRRVPFTVALVAALTALCVALLRGSDWPVWQQITVYCCGLFACCMTCHGELYRLRPAPEHLTSFYLAVAAGGAIGGILVAVAAPALFTDYYELHWGMFLCAALFVLVCFAQNRSSACDGMAVSRHDPDAAQDTKSSTTLQAPPEKSTEWRWLAYILPVLAVAGLDRFISHLNEQHASLPKFYFITARVVLWAFLLATAIGGFVRYRSKNFGHWRLLACLWLLLGLAALGITLSGLSRKNNPDRIYTSRNFYGVLTVYEHRKDDPKARYYLLQHGRITHGLQFTDPEQANWPTSYYSPESGVALALNAELPKPRRIGVVGLGTGSLAAFARPDDYVRFYEINPEVQRLANSPFRYLPDCAGRAEVALGDARLSMEREPPQSFDLLALDAFSSDSIPVHLLTREAFALYERHLKTNAVIAVHISNHYLDLEPVVANLAREFNYKIAVIDYEETPEDWWLYSSTWVLLTRDAHLLASPEIAAASLEPKHGLPRVPLWTDDFVSLFQILK